MGYLDYRKDHYGGNAMSALYCFAGFGIFAVVIACLCAVAWLKELAS
jgi:hypothetical protein